MRQESEQLQAQAEEIAADQRTEDDYTSLYWKEKSSEENEYEQVDPSASGIHNMKESLLQELKRDIARFIKGDKLYTQPVKRRGKTVNVRPGLALGVITLQVQFNDHHQ
ncbi:uncharacterized protein LOC111704117 [Eurytemora carolleeae]|uniref:uncharacterized protein LOC111704117 n=1 Tax=Eurytemora carolleeae TaxID=1294199 RepID=UPI000C76D3B8|nr:uncharacterized protein LOC111704117 [Eurytemora carolleeae]|eukprot:XP_023332022.1 uncharacterized protein LOC111704117 [Eurytemora affinis]